MSEQASIPALTKAIQGYFDLVYDCDTSRFDQVFRPTSQLHGFWDGAMTLIPAQAFKDNLAGRVSPRSAGARRQEEILLIDFASPDQAFTKVRVRMNATVFVDYLTWHRIDGTWLITSKGFHVESIEGREAPAAHQVAA
jgi:hypothetical protein